MNTSLKIGKLPDTTPVKVGISVEPDLESDLQTYAQIYEQSYGEKVTIALLIPSMLQAFLASDTGFKKAKRQLEKQS